MSERSEANLTDADERLIFKLRKILEEEDIVEFYFNLAEGVMIWNTNTAPSGHRYQRKFGKFAIRSEVPQKRG